MADIKIYYELIKAREAEISRAALAGELPEGTYTVGTTVHPITRQPQRVCTAVFITSLDNYEKNVTPGAIVTALPRIAAERIVQGTHTLATAEHVTAEKSRQAGEKERNDRTEGLLNRRTQIAIKVPQN